jgi:hypothetical protein
MKKVVVLFIVLGFVSASFAEEVKNELPLKVSVSGMVYGTNYNTVIKDVNGDYSAFRIRPLFAFTDGNIEAVMLLEYDAVFGQKAYSGSDSTYNSTVNKQSEYVGLGADKKGLEVAKAYIKSKVDGIPGLVILAGIAPYEFPLVYADNAALATVYFEMNPVKINLYYVKPSEGTMTDSKDDAQIYIADATLKLGDSSIRPAFFAFQCKDQAEFGPYKDSIGYIYGLSVNLVTESVGITASGAYINGKDKLNKTDYSSYAFDIAPYIKSGDAFKLTAFFTMVSGDDDLTDGEDNSFINATIDGKGSSGINNFRLFIIEDGGSFTTYSDVTNTGTYTNYNGYMAYGLAINAKLGPVSAKVQGAYAQAVKVTSSQKKDMGIEVDANIGYTLTKTSTLYIEGAYLKAGKFYETTDTSTGAPATVEKQNPYYVNVGMKYSI